MTWWGWILVALYVLAALYAWRVFAYVVAHESAFRAPKADDIAVGIVVGAIGACVWPIPYALYCVSTRGRSFLLAPRAVRRENEREAMRARIAELETSLRMERL